MTATLPKKIEVRLAGERGRVDRRRTDRGRASDAVVDRDVHRQPGLHRPADRQLPRRRWWPTASSLAPSGSRSAPIVKPAWRMEVTTDKRAVLTGTSVNATIQASFFDGTPVAGVDLQIGSDQEGSEEETGLAARTGVDGVATTPVTVALPAEEYDDSQWSWRDVAAHPTLPEEASIDAGTSVATFRSTALLDADSVLDGTHLTVTGKVSDVDFARMALADPFDWSVDPAGAPRAGATVKLTFTELVPTRERTGTTYDFILKRTVPVYDYDQREVDLGTRTVTTGADGTFRTARVVTGGDARLPDRRALRRRGRADHLGPRVRGTRHPPRGRRTAVADVARPFVRGRIAEYSVGERVRVTMRGGHPVPADRSLPVHGGASRPPAGDRPVRSDVRRHVPRRLGARTPTSAPSGSMAPPTTWRITATRPTSGPPTGSCASPSPRTSPRYEPGGTVRVAVRTTDPAGHPVAATAVVRVIDKKLYEIGLASDVDVLASLYTTVSSGVVATAWSHRAPSDDGGGDTGGGGGDEYRVDFRDWLYFDVVKTDATGQASLSFELSDDLTAWRLSAGAVDRSLRAGNAVVDIPVGLPFFAEATLAPEYLVGDQADAPGSRLRIGADDRRPGLVRDLGPVPRDGEDHGERAGLHRGQRARSRHSPKATIRSGSWRPRAPAPRATRTRSSRTIRVVTSRVGQGRTASAPLTAGFDLQGGTTGFTTIALADGGRGRVIPVLLRTIDTSTGRSDQLMAATIARQVLADTFAMPTDSLATDEADLASFQRPEGGMALLPYASADLELSSLAALAGDTRIEPDDPRAVPAIRRRRHRGDDARDTSSRSPGSPPSVSRSSARSVAPRRTPRCRRPSGRGWRWARSPVATRRSAAQLERSILAKNGQRLGPWVRLALKDVETSTTTTALLAIVASGLGDPLAAGMDAYIEAYPPSDTILDLQRALAARLWAERTPGASATLSMTVDGTTRTIAVHPDSPTWLTLTPGAAGDRVAGTGERHGDRHLGLGGSTRSVVAAQGRHLDLRARGRAVRRGPHRWRRHGHATPSGWTRPPTRAAGSSRISSRRAWRRSASRRAGGRYEDERGRWNRVSTTARGGSRDNAWTSASSVDPKHPVQTLRYIARVVSPGTYRWEPAVIQSSIVREHGAVLPATTVVIADAR